MENAQQEARHFKQQLNEHIRKFDAAKARIRVLESENSSFKAHIQTLTDKGVRNDDFIQVLQVFHLITFVYLQSFLSWSFYSFLHSRLKLLN